MIHFQVCAQTTIFGVSLKDNRLVLSRAAQAEPKQKYNHSVRKNTNILNHSSKNRTFVPLANMCNDVIRFISFLFFLSSEVHF